DVVDAERRFAGPAEDEARTVEVRAELAVARARHVERDEGADLVDDLQVAGPRGEGRDEEANEVEVRAQVCRHSHRQQHIDEAVSGNGKRAGWEIYVRLPRRIGTRGHRDGAFIGKLDCRARDG